MHYKEKKRSKTLVFLLTVDVCICVCILLAAWAIFLKEPQAVALAPESESLEVEPNQTPIVEQISSSESSNESASSDSNDGEEDSGGNKVSLRFSDQVTISLTNKTATLIFGSGERSLMDIVLQVVVQDHVLAQSGKIMPGNQVEQLSLAEGAVELLNESSYKGKFMLYYYDRQTGEQKILNTDIPITITVQK